MMDRKYLVFGLGEERYGLPIERVERILPELAVTRVPRTPKAFLGVFELRGQVVPVLDARLRLGAAGPAASRSTFLVAQTASGRCALMVDRVEGIFALTLQHSDAVGANLVAGMARHEDGLVTLLDPDEVVPSGLRARVASANAELPLAA